MLRLFQKIKENFPPEQSLEHTIAGILSITVEDAYLLLRMQKELSFKDAVKLAHHFTISLDEVTGQQSSIIPFRFKALDYNITTLDDFFKSILQELKNIDNFGERQLIYAANDFPVFSLFQFPELAAFKLFFWGKTVYNLPSFEHRKFNLEEIDMDSLRLGERAWQQYLKMPSVEIWSSEITNNVLKQLYYFWKQGLFVKKEDALIVCDKIAELINHVEAQAEVGKKFHPHKRLPKKDNYRLYYNEISISNNTIMINAEHSKRVFVLQNTLNYLVTDNTAFNLQTEVWLHNLTQQSVMLTGGNEELRKAFFDGLRSNIAFVKERIK